MAITINGVRFSYLNVFQPVARNGQEPKFSATILVPKNNMEAKAAIDRAIAEAMDSGVNSRWNGVRPPQPANCVHDGDGVRPSDGQPFGAECKGCWVFTASTKADRPPFVVDARVQTIIDPTQVYSGMWGNVNVAFFPYNANGKKGIGCGLNGVQKVRDGEPLGGRVTAQDAFSVVEAAPATPAYGGFAPQTAPATPAYGGFAPQTAPATPA
jgi:hypothetical protein